MLSSLCGYASLEIVLRTPPTGFKLRVAGTASGVVLSACRIEIVKSVVVFDVFNDIAKNYFPVVFNQINQSLARITWVS